MVSVLLLASCAAPSMAAGVATTIEPATVPAVSARVGPPARPPEVRADRSTDRADPRSSEVVVSTIVDRPEGDTPVDRTLHASTTVPSASTRSDPLAPVTSPDTGEHCAAGLDAADLSAFFGKPIGSFGGADYQRSFRLDDGRVLWVFQDAFVSGSLVHNVGMIQSGRCFTMLNEGARSWLLADGTDHMTRWHWILDGAMDGDGSRFHLFVVEMTETGADYLNRTRPTALRRVVIDTSTLEVVEVIDEQFTDGDLFGWSVTADADHTYLYSHCYQQFGHDTVLGIAECAVDVKLARIPLGSFDAPREFWTGSMWSPDRAAAMPVVDGEFVFSGNNPAQVRFDGDEFVLIEKRDDWWGRTIEIGIADRPQGPFAHVASIDEPVKCARSECNTYFAAWVPWRSDDGHPIWSIGHNVWSGRTAQHLDVYRPTFHTLELDLG